MNLLAHTYLSGESEQILTGNLMGDFIKGHDYNNFPAEIRKGILLHRHIDDFTDHHDIVRQSKSYFTQPYGKYAGVITDILYDHYLAKDWKNFSVTPFDEYLILVKEKLMHFYNVVPDIVKKYYNRFFAKNWMYTYSSIEGIENVLYNMSKYTSLPDETDFAMQIFKLKYEEIRDEFYSFFPKMIHSVEDKFEIEISCSSESHCC